MAMKDAHAVVLRTAFRFFHRERSTFVCERAVIHAAHTRRLVSPRRSSAPDFHREAIRLIGGLPEQ
jgi:hypothetical protein